MTGLGFASPGQDLAGHLVTTMTGCHETVALTTRVCVAIAETKGVASRTSPRPGPSLAGAGGGRRAFGGHSPVVPVRLPGGGRWRRLSLGTGRLGILTACWVRAELDDRMRFEQLVDRCLVRHRPYLRRLSCDRMEAPWVLDTRNQRILGSAWSRYPPVAARLLDTYHAERHPVAARVLRNTMAQTALLRPDDRLKALSDIISELLSMDEPRTRFAAMMTGLDIHYDLGEGHPLLGRRMPDLDLVTANGPLRVFTLLHDARPVLLNLGEPGIFDISMAGSGSVDRRQICWHVGASGTWRGHSSHCCVDPTRRICCLGGDLTDLGLPDALTTWFGRIRIR
jgi:hypothetical protein